MHFHVAPKHAHRDSVSCLSSDDARAALAKQRRSQPQHASVAKKSSKLRRSSTHQSAASLSGKGISTRPQTTKRKSVTIINTDKIMPNPNIRFIRVGTREWEAEQDEEAIKLTWVVVAAVDVVERTSDFYLVDSWTVGGQEIGHCEDGDEISYEELCSLNSFKWDNDMAPAPEDHDALNTLLHTLADGRTSLHDDSDFELPKPLAHPQIPTYLGSGRPNVVSKADSMRDILALIYCKNETDIDKNLKLPVNRQFWLDHDFR